MGLVICMLTKQAQCCKRSKSSMNEGNGEPRKLHEQQTVDG